MKLRYLLLIMALVIGAVAVIDYVSAEVQTLGTFRKADSIILTQGCVGSTYSNITYILYPNSSYALSPSQYKMTESSNDFYNYTLSTTSSLGQYIVYGHCDESAVDTQWVYDFYISDSGENFGLPQTILLMGQFAAVALFFGVGLTFRQEKWKVRTFFFMMSLLMGAVALNSLRIMIGTSSGLSTMGSSGLVLSIVVILFMFLYLFIYSLIEVFKYFRTKRNMRWEVNQQ